MKNKGETKNETEARGIVTWLTDDEKFTWSSLTERIHFYVDKFETVHVEKMTYVRAWETVFAKGGAKTKNGLFWTEFLTIAKAIESDIKDVKHQRINNKNVTRDVTTQDPIRYSLSKFQDTILPSIHKPALQRENNVIFEEQLSWNQCLDALIDEKIEVALHSFPTALAYISNPSTTNEIFFWPFFTFKGYALFVNRKKFESYCQNNQLPVTSFSDLRLKYGKEGVCKYLNSCEFVLERYTDVEWVLKDFVTKNGCDWNNLLANERLLDKDINEGKRKFKKEDYGDILCTNSLHVLDLEGCADMFELIEKGDKLTNHRNFNGLICTMQFFYKNQDVIEDLISSWFKCIAANKHDWELIMSNFRENDINNVIFQGLLDHLIRETFSDNIRLDVFIKSYTGNNDFFLKATPAFNKLFVDMYKESHKNDMDRNWEIAQIQNKHRPGKSKEEVFETILKNMNIVKSKIKLEN